MIEELWNRCVEFHGHACGGLAIGYRACEVACEQLGIDLERTEDEDLVCVTENDSCGIDAIQCLLSCTLGKGNMIMRMRGKPAYSFFDRRTSRSVRLVAGHFDRTMEKEKLIDLILNSPAEDVFTIREPGFDVPERARMFASVVCDECGESVREDLARLHDGRILCLDCSSEYKNRW
ncbi:MAG: FmdE family protein [Candidatus Methanomethylophilaceae archaeon]